MEEKPKASILVKRKRPRVTTSLTRKVDTGCGKIYVTLGWDGDYLVEVFSSLGKAGCCPRAQLQALTRSVSLGLKYGIPVEDYVDELKEIKCPYSSWDDGRQILSCSDAIAWIIQDECRNHKTNKVS